MKVVWNAYKKESGFAEKLKSYSGFILQDWVWLDRKLEAHFRKDDAAYTKDSNEDLNNEYIKFNNSKLIKR